MHLLRHPFIQIYSHLDLQSLIQTCRHSVLSASRFAVRQICQHLEMHLLRLAFIQTCMYSDLHLFRLAFIRTCIYSDLHSVRLTVTYSDLPVLRFTVIQAYSHLDLLALRCAGILVQSTQSRLLKLFKKLSLSTHCCRCQFEFMS